MDLLSSLVPEPIKRIPVHMDFDGQRRAERYFQIIILLFAVVGFIWGYITQLFSQTLYILFAGVLFSSILTLIPWGMYRKQPLQWQPAREPECTTLARVGQQGNNTGSPQQNKPKKKKLKD